MMKHKNGHRQLKSNYKKKKPMARKRISIKMPYTISRTYAQKEVLAVRTTGTRK